MEIVTSMVRRIGDYLIDTLGRQIGYLIGYLVHYNSNSKNLNKKAGRLADTRERVQGRIDAARRNAEFIETDVQKWVTGVDTITAEAENFLEDEVKNKRCLNGWCINLSSCYRFSKEAQRKTLAISELQEEGRFENVSHPAPPLGIETYSSRHFRAFESRKLVMKQIMKALNDDNIYMIGICGMGGVGKTTLVKEIGKQAKEDKLFDQVVMAVVSQTPSLTKIQEEIANMLDMKLHGNSEPERARSLWARINNEKRILVILDDVWGSLELEMVGIPFGRDHKGCKIVLTSRNQDVCGNEMDAQKIFPVGVLSEEEACVLFREMAGETVDSTDLNLIAREVAIECGGLPIAIVTVGKALKNKSKHVWTNAAQELKKSIPKNIGGMHKKVFSSLELSYNYLESDEAKSCFLLCCLFPEDYNIPVEELMRYGMGLRLFQNVDTVEYARARAHTVVSILIASFLLMDGDEEGYVKMHDVVRDVAISIASKDDKMFLVKAGCGLQEWPNKDTYENYARISLMSNNIHELPDGLECPKLQILLLQHNSPLEIPNNFFQGMKDLKVLEMSATETFRYGKGHRVSLPPSLSFLANLRTLNLNNCNLGGDISVIGRLLKLEILSFSGSDINEIPRHIGQLTRLRLFDLTACQGLTIISQGVISSLGKLEELCMRRSFLNWEAEGEGNSRSNASLAELKSLSRLTSLHVRMPNASILPRDLHFQNLERFTISIGNDQDDMSYNCLRKLSLTHEMGIPLLNWVKVLLKRTESLRLVSCKNLKNILNDLENEGFNELKSLVLRSCDDMKYLLNTMEWVPQVAFRSLEQLAINNLLNFNEICHGELPAESFSKVRTLDVNTCHNILNAVPSKLLQRLQNLETFTALNCNSLVYVYDLEGLVIENEDTKFLSMLKELALFRLPEVTHIWKGPTQFVSLCNLNLVEVAGCKKLRILFPPALAQGLVCLENLHINSCDCLEEIFKKREEGEEEKEIQVWKKDPSGVSCFPNLTVVQVDNCNKLRNLFSTSIAKGLVQLKQLDVESSATMQQIIADEKGEAASSTEKIVFSRLYSMTLRTLGGLTSFCPGCYTIEWPSLEILTIDGCPKMETFGYGVQMTPKLKKVEVADAEEIWMGDLNATVQHIFKKQALALQESAMRPEHEPEIIASET